MADHYDNNEHFSRRERSSSGWQSASERRSNSQRQWRRDNSSDYRSESRHNDRSDRRGGYRRHDRDDRRDGFRRDDSDRGFRGGERSDRGFRRDDRSYGRDDRRGGYRRHDRDDRRDNRFESKSQRGQGRDRRENAQLPTTELEVPESITFESLDPTAYRRLNSLNVENAHRVARHLAYAGEMVDIDPEIAYQHAKAAFVTAARIDIVREALGITAYMTGRYAEALRELRTYRRMSDDYQHVPLEADSERGMGRPEKALRFIEGIPMNRLEPAAQVELAFVVSGARAETGDSEGGLAVMEKLKITNLPHEVAVRANLIKADRLEELGRAEEAAQLRAKYADNETSDEVDVYDLNDVLDDMKDEDLHTPLASEEEDTDDLDFAGDDFDDDDLEDAPLADEAIEETDLNEDEQ
ncbi:hypothetical protein ACTOVL_03650 [Arcanobacterium canis]